MSKESSLSFGGILKWAICKRSFFVTFSGVDKTFSLSEDQMEIVYVFNNKDNTLTSLKDFEHDSTVVEEKP